MYINIAKCPICGKEQEYSIRNSKNNDNHSCENSDSIILSNLSKDIFNVECNIKCLNCKNKFKIIKEVEFDLS